MVDSHKFGDEIEDYVRFAAPKPKAAGENRLRAVVLKVDRFGNLITNVTPPTLLRCLRSPQGSRLWWEAARLRTSARTSLKATRGKSLAYSGVWAISRSWPTARLRRRSLALARVPRSASF